jgi:Pentapeptide repeats (8 copies)
MASFMVAAIGLIVALVVVIALISLEIRLYGTGFTGKRLWDWLQLLIIPLVIAGGGYLFTLAMRRNEQQNTMDNQREAALQVYIDKISELLLHEKLHESPPPNEVQVIAQARTATVLRILDPIRRASLIQFLSQSGILAICVENSVKGSFDLPLNNENSLRGIELPGTNLNGVNLSMIHMEEVNLQQSSLKQANLQGIDLSKANLRGADLSHANLQKAILIGADLQGTRLFMADLRGANLTGTNLERANLRDATITQEQWEKAKSLKGATMPDGTKHD